MHKAIFSASAALGASLLLAGCASSGTFPSLAQRESERVSGTMQPPPRPAYTPAPTSPATLAQLDGLLASVRSSHQRFTAATPAARSAVAAARGASLGSDAWSQAQVAVAGLESTRSEAMIALADLDRLLVDAAVDGAEVARIGAARDAAAALVAEENATIASLLSGLE